ncbi:glycosyltransferase family 1 protein [Methanosarcina hadiensis]|uniref:glycosyltransferase family 4 protein n=1 Tax=Methanosarcina hadiensis TaxID=3078083 RepID=UPI0039777193
MKVGILADRLNRPRTGIGNYTYNLIKELDSIDPIQNEIFLINYELNDLFPNLNKIIVPNPLKNIIEKSFYIWHLYLQSKLKKTNFGIDIIHSPENATPFLKIKPKKIITVHDITPFLFPGSFSSLTLFRYRLLFRRTLKTADKIISDSYNTKRDLINYFNVPDEKISVVHLGIDEKFRVLDVNTVDRIREKYSLNYPFILYVGTLEPRKNIPTLIKAFCEIKNKNSIHKLVIAGKKGWKYKDIFNMIDELHLRDEIIFTDYVPYEDLPGLYNAADLFVYPSLYEGFGFPPLEAMACGCPVITSNSSSLPEVVGDAGLMFDPYNYLELKLKICDILTNSHLRDDLVKKGLKRVADFSWNKCSRETIKIYQEVYCQKNII